MISAGRHNEAKMCKIDSERRWENKAAWKIGKGELKGKTSGDAKG